MEVLLLSEAAAELEDLPRQEKMAMLAGLEKLEVLGELLRFPHTSAVQGINATLRKLRPRGGRSRHRALYRRNGDVMVIAAIGPEAGIDPRGFQRAVASALERLDQYR